MQLAASLPACLRIVETSLVCMLLATAAKAQCGTQWAPGGGVPGIDGAPRVATMWDPDGPGPAPASLVFGGSFAIAGDVFADNIVARDEMTGAWTSFGQGTNGFVLSLAPLPSGPLVAAGTFTEAGGAPAGRIAQWDGSSWSSLGGGMNGDVLALLVLPNGDLVAGGFFTTAGGVSVSNIARWDAIQWFPGSQATFYRARTGRWQANLRRLAVCTNRP